MCKRRAIYLSAQSYQREEIERTKFLRKQLKKTKRFKLRVSERRKKYKTQIPRIDTRKAEDIDDYAVTE